MGVSNMKRHILAIILCLTLFLGAGTVALASDIIAALYYGVIQISNNSTAASNVYTTANISTQNLIDGGYLNSTANNSAIQNTSGADVPFMPGINGNPWAIYVPTIGANSLFNNILYTNATGGELRYFPADGGMTTADNATMELGDNFTIERKGFVDTDNGTNKNLSYKSSAFRTYVSETVSGNITAAILSVNEDWVSPTGSSGSGWADPSNVYDENTGNYAWVFSSSNTYTTYLTTTIAATDTNRIRYWVTDSAASAPSIDRTR